MKKPYEWPLNVGSRMVVESTVDLGLSGGHLLAVRADLNVEQSRHLFEMKLPPALIARLVAMRARFVAGNKNIPKNLAGGPFVPFPFLSDVRVEPVSGEDLVVLRGLMNLEIARGE